MEQVDSKVCLTTMSVRQNLQIKKIQIEDLDYLEKDLDFHDKVSLLFLLYGNNRDMARFALQRICIGLQMQLNSNYYTCNYLTEWCFSMEQQEQQQQRKGYYNNNWQFILVEALTIIKSYRILRKLGLSQSELLCTYFPNNPYLSVHINPILKCLYHLCEQLTPDEANIMVHTINQTKMKTNLSKICTTSHENYLEIAMLRWLSEKIIDIETINIKPIVEFLKSIRKNHLKDVLLTVVNKYETTVAGSNSKNSTANGNYHISEEILNKKLNISATSNSNSSSSSSSGGSGSGSGSGDGSGGDGSGGDGSGGDSCSGSSNNTPSTNKLEITLEKFEIRKTHAGVALIINQRDFLQTNPNEKKLDQRVGTDLDKCELAKTFTSFGYKVIIRENQREKQLINEINEAVLLAQNYDSFFLCILSHGLKDFIYDCHSNKVPVDKIKEIVITNKLLGKPKFILIQACRGKDIQLSEQINNDKIVEYDSPRYEKSNQENSWIPYYSDTCIMYSTVPGYLSIRHPENGSWFIQTFCKFLNECGDHEDFAAIWTLICNHISKLRGKFYECMMPVCENNFRKKFFLPPRN